MTYALVKYGAQIPVPRLEPIEEVRAFLTEHVEKLLTETRQVGAAPAGFFDNSQKQKQFRELHSGDDTQFLDAYRALAVALVAQMNGTTKLGLLVGVRATTATDGVIAGVMKLEVLSEHGATLESHVENGRVRLAAVKDVLDKPGKLQKCAIVTSNLPDEKVFSKDQLQDASKYFLAAFGIKIHPRPRAAMRTFYEVVQEIAPSDARRIEDAVITCSPGTVASVLTEVAGKVPEVTPAIQFDIVESLNNRDQPVTVLDPAHAIQGVYTLGDITINAPMPVLAEFVRVEKRDEGWQVIIECPTEPRLTRK
ncbi:hypothetical protein AB0C65_20135 [Nocardia sp. NPDC048505]